MTCCVLKLRSSCSLIKSELMIDERCRWTRRVISQTVSSDPTDPTDPTEPLYCSVIYRTQLWNSPWCRCCPLQGVTCHRDPPNKQLEFKRRRGSFSVSDSASDVTDETFNTFTLHSVSRRDAESAILKLHSEVSHTQWLSDSVTQWLGDSLTRWLADSGLVAVMSCLWQQAALLTHWSCL